MTDLHPHPATAPSGDKADPEGAGRPSAAGGAGTGRGRSAAGPSGEASAPGRAVRASSSGDPGRGDGSAGDGSPQPPPPPSADPVEEDEIVAGPVVIVIDDPAWRETDLPVLAREAAEAALAALALPADAVTFNLLATSDAAIRVLNARFRGKDRPTNVLSWPAVDRAPSCPGGKPCLPGADELPPVGGGAGEPLFLGDLAIARETVLREAMEAGRPVADHLRHLVIHGLLHLLGYDHETEADAERMERLERSILAGLAIPDPYAAFPAETAAQESGEGGR